MKMIKSWQEAQLPSGKLRMLIFTKGVECSGMIWLNWEMWEMANIYMFEVWEGMIDMFWQLTVKLMINRIFK